MIEGWNPVAQAFLGTLFTWGLTAAGAALVLFVSGSQRKLLDASLGFAAGVMLAASYWSLLAPAIDIAVQSGTYGSNGEWAFLPVAIGFALGAVFVDGADKLLSHFGFSSESSVGLAMQGHHEEVDNYTSSVASWNGTGGSSTTIVDGLVEFAAQGDGRLPRYRGSAPPTMYKEESGAGLPAENSPKEKRSRWRRIVLLIVAITVHNIPEGLAVGVGFGAVGSAATATFEAARNLAIGIGLQNFPEGLAVSLPLKGAGMSTFKSFWYGQLSGMVEPVSGVFGACAVQLVQPSLPYCLSFAAGAMIYVVMDDIVPESNQSGNGKLASWGAVVGFILMMCLDVGLG